MVRPKASGQNLRIAIEFTKLVTTTRALEAWKVPRKEVKCNGSRSVFSLLAQCAPGIVRESKDPNPSNRSGVSEMELNKALSGLGYEYMRKRVDNCGPTLKWYKIWRNCHWLNPSDQEDVAHLHQGLATFSKMFPNLCLPRVDDLLEAISLISASDRRDMSFEYSSVKHEGNDNSFCSTPDSSSSERSSSPPCSDWCAAKNEKPANFVDINIVYIPGANDMWPLADPFSAPADFEWMVATQGWQAATQSAAADLDKDCFAPKPSATWNHTSPFAAASSSSVFQPVIAGSYERTNVLW